MIFIGNVMANPLKYARLWLRLQDNLIDANVQRSIGHLIGH